MTRAILLSLLCLGVGSIGGCASTPTSEELATASFGEYPSDYQNVIRNHLRETLKDPDSLRDLEMTAPRKAFFRESLYDSMHYGWVSLVTFNAKNSFGGYVGRRGYFAMFGTAGSMREWLPAEEVSTSIKAFGQGCHFYGFVESTGSTTSSTAHN